MKNRRIPRNYKGIKSSIRTVQELLPITMGCIDKIYAKQSHRILQSWPEIIGEKLSKMTKACSINKGVLTVKVKSSTLLSLLSQQEKLRLLKILQQKFSSEAVQDIRFIIG